MISGVVLTGSKLCHLQLLIALRTASFRKIGALGMKVVVRVAYTLSSLEKFSGSETYSL